MIKTLLFIGFLSVCCFAQADHSAEQRWHFDVLMDQQKIGEHTFVVRPAGSADAGAQQGPAKQVEIDADFNVKVLFFNAYSYQHTNQESWQGNCLVALSSRTNDNGENIRVQAATENQQFVVRTSDTTETFPACPMSFAYWNPAFLSATRLINPQTGELLPVEVSPTGMEQVNIAGETLSANRYELKLEDQTIRLWYASDDYRWLALESPARGNRTLRYQATALPAPHQQQAIHSPTEHSHAMAY